MPAWNGNSSQSPCGFTCCISEMRHTINEDVINIRTNEVETFPNKESLFVFSSKFSVADIADTIRSNDKTPVAALELRKAPLTLALQLNDRFCDAQEFENSWKNTIIPHTVMFY